MRKNHHAAGVCLLITKPFQHILHTSRLLTNNCKTCRLLHGTSIVKYISVQNPLYLLFPSRNQCLTLFHIWPLLHYFFLSCVIKSLYKVDLKRICTLDDSTESEVKEPWQVRAGFICFVPLNSWSFKEGFQGPEQRCDWKPGPLGTFSSCLIHKFPISAHQALWSRDQGWVYALH